MFEAETFSGIGVPVGAPDSAIVIFKITHRFIYCLKPESFEVISILFSLSSPGPNKIEIPGQVWRERAIDENNCH